MIVSMVISDSSSIVVVVIVGVDIKCRGMGDLSVGGGYIVTPQIFLVFSECLIYLLSNSNREIVLVVSSRHYRGRYRVIPY